MNNKVERWLTIATMIGWGASIGSMLLLSWQATTPEVAIPRLTPPATAGTIPVSGQKSSTQMSSLEVASPTSANGASELREAKK